MSVKGIIAAVLALSLATIAVAQLAPDDPAISAVAANGRLERHALRYPKTAWTMLGLSGAGAVATIVCAAQASSSYRQYQSAADATSMLRWRDKTTRYDRAAVTAGALTATVAAVTVSLLTMWVDGVSVEISTPAAGRRGVVIAGRF